MTQGLLQPAPYSRVPGASFSAAKDDHVTCAVHIVVNNDSSSSPDTPVAQSSIDITLYLMLIRQQPQIAIDARDSGPE